ncbi:MAG: hypothetical protein PUG90_04825 [Clostridia bacterium]|nr:hypothetical protein [Clostridia bacterium]MDY4083601.1 hypothetical protein [Eubacteriales bacterium]
MKIIEQKKKVKCDMSGCKNTADYSVFKEGNSPDKYLNLCKECLQAIYEQASSVFVPKSPKNILQKDLGKGGWRK